MASVVPTTRLGSLRHSFTVTNVILGIAGLYYIGTYCFVLHYGIFGEDGKIYGPTWAHNLYGASVIVLVAIGVTLLCAIRWRLASLITVIALTYVYFFITVLEAETKALALDTGLSSHRINGLIFNMNSAMLPTILMGTVILAERLAAKKQQSA